MSKSILSHLALRFSQHPENIATEALSYILSDSDEAAAGMSRILQGICTQTSEHRLFYKAQHSNEDGGRPDLVGRDTHGKVRLVLEAKFWAALTDQQPVGYLKNLPESGVLLFVAPERRLTLLWQEIEGRLQNAEFKAEPVSDSPFRIFRVGGKSVALTSWRFLLEQLHGSLEAAGEIALSADLRQLMHLCERMDTDAFIVPRQHLWHKIEVVI